MRLLQQHFGRNDPEYVNLPYLRLRLVRSTQLLNLGESNCNIASSCKSLGLLKSTVTQHLQGYRVTYWHHAKDTTRDEQRCHVKYGRSTTSNACCTCWRAFEREWTRYCTSLTVCSPRSTIFKKQTPLIALPSSSLLNYCSYPRHYINAIHVNSWSKSDRFSSHYSISVWRLQVVRKIFLRKATSNRTGTLHKLCS